MSVAENIRFGRLSPKVDAVNLAAQIAHADSFIQEMPEKYDTIIGERGLKLSGGQRQRLSLARALFNDPPLLILDEATSALDAESETAVQDALDQLSGKRTMLVIAHRFSTIRKADFVIVLRDGKVIEFGKQEDLLSIDGEFSRLHKLHFLET
jgi:ABC-type multidrug transport system fused ATPase/permease subunit